MAPGQNFAARQEVQLQLHDGRRPHARPLADGARRRRGWWGGRGRRRPVSGAGDHHTNQERQSALLHERILHSIKEVDDARFERVLGADDDEALLLNQLLQDIRAVPQLAGGDADVGAHGLPHERLLVVAKLRLQ